MFISHISDTIRQVTRLADWCATERDCREMEMIRHLQVLGGYLSSHLIGHKFKPKVSKKSKKSKIEKITMIIVQYTNKNIFFKLRWLHQRLQIHEHLHGDCIEAPLSLKQSVSVLQGMQHHQSHVKSGLMHGKERPIHDSPIIPCCTTPWLLKWSSEGPEETAKHSSLIQFIIGKISHF